MISRAGHVAGHQVGRELDPLEGQVRGLGQRADQQGLGQPGHAFQQGVAAGEDGHQHLLDHLVLADDHLGQFLPDLVVRLLAPLDGGKVVLAHEFARHSQARWGRVQVRGSGEESRAVPARQRSGFGVWGLRIWDWCFVFRSCFVFRTSYFVFRPNRDS